MRCCIEILKLYHYRGFLYTVIPNDFQKYLLHLQRRVYVPAKVLAREHGRRVDDVLRVGPRADFHIEHVAVDVHIADDG